MSDTMTTAPAATPLDRLLTAALRRAADEPVREWLKPFTAADADRPAAEPAALAAEQ
jgi:hypothetical protein